MVVAFATLLWLPLIRKESGHLGALLGPFCSVRPTCLLLVFDVSQTFACIATVETTQGSSTVPNTVHKFEHAAKGTFTQLEHTTTQIPVSPRLHAIKQSLSRQDSLSYSLHAQGS